MNPISFIKDTFKEVYETVLREVEFYGVKPQVGTLFLTYRCTSRCNTCKMWQKPAQEDKELSLSQWEYIVNILQKKRIKAIEIFGGDVLLRKDLLIPLIRYIKNLGLKIHLPTNCNLLDKDTARELIKAKVDVLYLSVDGVGDGHNKIRGVEGVFDKVTKAIGYLNQARNGSKITRLVCNTTVSKYNVAILENIAQFAKDRRFDEQHYEYVGEMTEDQINNSIIDGLRPAPYYVKSQGSVLVSEEQAILLKKKLKEIRKKYKNALAIKTINIDMLSVDNLSKGAFPISKCYVERREITIDPFGNVIICPFINNYIMGNLLIDDFENIWNNKIHKAFRRYQNSKQIEICDHCILSVQRNHSFLASLRRIFINRVVHNQRLVS